MPASYHADGAFGNHEMSNVKLRPLYRVAFVEKGRTVRFATLEEVIGTDSSLVYGLTSAPADLGALSAAVPGASLTFQKDACELVCRYDPRRFAAEAVNAQLLPALLALCGVRTVSQGSNLETEYLRTT